MFPNRKYANFVHLHVHSHYSLLDGAATVKAIVDAAKRFNMPAVCITDHGNMYAAIELYHEAIKKGLKPIMGFEAYITAGSRLDKTRESHQKFPTHHLVLLAKNEVGYKNLLKLASIGHIEGFYYKPRIDHEVLEKHSEGLIGLSACLAGEIPAALLNDDKEKAISILKYYQGVFGKENFYVEIQNHGLPEQLKVLRPLIEIAKECEAPLVATNESQYVNPEDAPSVEHKAEKKNQEIVADKKPQKRQKNNTDKAVQLSEPVLVKNNFKSQVTVEEIQDFNNEIFPSGEFAEEEFKSQVTEKEIQTFNNEIFTFGEYAEEEFKSQVTEEEIQAYRNEVFPSDDTEINDDVNENKTEELPVESEHEKTAEE